MKRTAAALLPVVLLSAVPAWADAYDCFPTCVEAPAKNARIDLCRHQVVRDVARADRDLKPVKELYEAATNPTGFALKQINDRVVHVPPWVGYAVDPRGAIKAKVMERARGELKKQVGLEHECVEPVEAEDGAGAAAEDTP